MLEKEFKYFQDHRDELVRKFANRFIVIVGESVIGDYSSELEAFTEAKKQHEPGTFLIQSCFPDAEKSVRTFHTRVIIAA